MSAPTLRDASPDSHLQEKEKEEEEKEEEEKEGEKEEEEKYSLINGP